MQGTMSLPLDKLPATNCSNFSFSPELLFLVLYKSSFDHLTYYLMLVPNYSFSCFWFSHVFYIYIYILQGQKYPLNKIYYMYISNF